jgi:hypothetical protein
VIIRKGAGGLDFANTVARGQSPLLEINPVGTIRYHVLGGAIRSAVRGSAWRTSGGGDFSSNLGLQTSFRATQFDEEETGSVEAITGQTDISKYRMPKHRIRGHETSRS